MPCPIFSLAKATTGVTSIPKNIWLIPIWWNASLYVQLHKLQPVRESPNSDKYLITTISATPGSFSITIFLPHAPLETRFSVKQKNAGSSVSNRWNLHTFLIIAPNLFCLQHESSFSILSSHTPLLTRFDHPLATSYFLIWSGGIIWQKV